MRSSASTNQNMFPLHPEIATTAENTSPTQCISSSASLNNVKNHCSCLHKARYVALSEFGGYMVLQENRLFSWWSEWLNASWQCWEQGSNHFLHLEKWRFKTKYQHTCKPLILQDFRYHRDVTTVTLACQILSWKIPWPNSHLQWGCQWTTGRNSYMILDATKKLA